MKIDLVGPARRGFALGLNEAAGYGAVALTALATGDIAARHGLRPEPFYLGIAFAGARPRPLDPVRARDPRPRPPRSRHHRPPRPTPTTGSGSCSPAPPGTTRPSAPSARPGSSTTPSTASPGASSRCCSPPADSPCRRIGVLAALYPGVWCVGQLFTGAWSDRVGRKPLIVAGMILQGVALALMAATTGFGPWAVGRRAHRRRDRPRVPDADRRRRRPSPTPAGGPPPSASTGCGATPATSSAPSSAASSPTPSTCAPPSGSSPPSASPPGSSSPPA